MSLVVAIQIGSNDVVLAADRRGTYGDPQGLVAVDENVPKLFPYGEQAVLGIVGNPGAVLWPMREAQALLAAGPAGDPVAILRQTLKKHYTDHYGLRPLITPSPVIDSRPLAIVLYADRRPGGVGLIQLQSFDNFAPTPVARPYAMLGVATYAQYLFQRMWRDDFAAHEAIRLAAFLICETGRLDPKVGTTPDVMVLGETGVRQMPREEISAIVNENDNRVAAFAQSFRSTP